MGEADEKRGMALWLKLVLFASLAFNLLIVGVVAGWFASKGPPGRGPEEGARAGADVGVEPFVRALSRRDRIALLRDIREEGPILRENRDVLRQRFERLLSAIRAQPFDPAVLRSVIAEQRSAALDRQAVGERLLLARLVAMTAEERDEYARRLEQGLRRGREERRSD